MKTLILGKGQVGSALYEVLKDHHETFIKDVEPLEMNGVEVLHICYPEHNEFTKTTKDYMSKYKPQVTIVNSSVSIGTTEKCGDEVIYSPVRGRHPKLAADLKIYAKFLFGHDKAKMALAAEHFNQAGIKIRKFRDPEAGEALKLLSNIHMGVEIAFRQEIERILGYFMVDVKAYETWEKTYMEGYLESGDYNLIRPMMRPDPIGGHCILPCTEILMKQFPSKIFEFVLESNEKTKGEPQWN